MKREPVLLLRKLSVLHKNMAAIAIGLAIASGAAADPVQTLQITSGFMTSSSTNPFGQWMLAAPDLSATGRFRATGGQGPAVITQHNFGPPGTSFGMSWFADGADGLTFDSTMVFNGVAYNLAGDTVNSGSLMTLDASAIVVNHVGSYMEPFTFSASLCGFLTVPMDNCDATVNVAGSGTLDLVVVSQPGLPGAVGVQSVSYRFAGVPEPASIALLLSGLVGLGLTRRRASALQSGQSRC